MFILPLVFIFLIFVLLLYVTNKCDEHTIYGQIVRSKQEIQKGLMFRKHKLRYNEGMLFNMNRIYNSMWMKNTYIPLDIIFLDNMNVVGYIMDAIPLSEEPLQINKISDM